jgi:hypothetical protein
MWWLYRVLPWRGRVHIQRRHLRLTFLSAKTAFTRLTVFFIKSFTNDKICLHGTRSGIEPESPVHIRTWKWNAGKNRPSSWEFNYMQVFHLYSHTDTLSAPGIEWKYVSASVFLNFENSTPLLFKRRTYWPHFHSVSTQLYKRPWLWCL